MNRLTAAEAAVLWERNYCPSMPFGVTCNTCLAFGYSAITKNNGTVYIKCEDCCGESIEPIPLRDLNNE